MWTVAYSIFLVLTLGALVCHGADTVPVAANPADYPYVVLIKDATNNKFFVGLTVARLYVVTSAEITSGLAPDSLTIVYSNSDTSIGAKIVSDDQVTVLKACTMTYPIIANVYKLTPSLFFDSAAATSATAATFIYFHPKTAVLMSGTTKVLPDAQCPAEILAEVAPSGVTYNPTNHLCLMNDCTADCSWINRDSTATPPTFGRPALVVNNQVVGFFRGGSCSSSNEWNSAVIYNKILPSRSYIMTSSHGMAIVP